jgi:hypothetical protein
MAEFFEYKNEEKLLTTKIVTDSVHTYNKMEWIPTKGIKFMRIKVWKYINENVTIGYN